MKELRRRSGKTYPFKVEQRGPEVQMLDVTLYKQRIADDTYSLQWRPFAKPTSQRIYLDRTSGHAPGILESWPVAEAKRLARRSSHISDFIIARNLLIQKLRAIETSPSVVERILSVNFFSASQPAPRRPLDSQLPRTIWWPVSFHPVLYRASLLATCRGVYSDWKNLIGPFSDDFAIKIAWKNAGRNLETAVTTVTLRALV